VSLTLSLNVLPLLALPALKSLSVVMPIALGAKMLTDKTLAVILKPPLVPTALTEEKLLMFSSLPLLNATEDANLLNIALNAELFQDVDGAILDQLLDA